MAPCFVWNFTKSLTLMPLIVMKMPTLCTSLFCFYAYYIYMGSARLHAGENYLTTSLRLLVQLYPS